MKLIFIEILSRLSVIVMHAYGVFSSSILCQLTALGGFLCVGAWFPDPVRFPANMTALALGIGALIAIVSDRVADAVNKFAKSRSATRIEIQKSEEAAYRESYQAKLDHALAELRRSKDENLQTKQEMKDQNEQVANNTRMIERIQNEKDQLEIQLASISTELLSAIQYLKPDAVNPDVIQSIRNEITKERARTEILKISPESDPSESA